MKTVEKECLTFNSTVWLKDLKETGLMLLSLGQLILLFWDTLDQDQPAVQA